MKQDSLNALFSGLTRADGAIQPPPVQENIQEGKEEKDTPQADGEAQTRPRQKRSVARTKQIELELATGSEHLCTIVKSITMKKIRTIAQRERLQIKDVIDAALDKAITAYERKHGVIEFTKKDPKDLF